MPWQKLNWHKRHCDRACWLRPSFPWGACWLRPSFPRGACWLRPSFPRGACWLRPSFPRGACWLRPSFPRGACWLRPSFPRVANLAAWWGQVSTTRWPVPSLSPLINHAFTAPLSQPHLQLVRFSPVHTTSGTLTPEPCSLSSMSRGVYAPR